MINYWISGCCSRSKHSC